MCNTQNVTVRNSFIRSFDDGMVLKGVKGRSGGARPLPGQSFDGLPVRNIRMSGLVIWCDWGRALEIGAETSTPEMTDVVFRDIDVIRNTHIAMDIQHSDRAAIHNIRYEDIRVEVDDANPLPVIQQHPGEKYNPRAQVPAARLRRMRYRAARGRLRPEFVRHRHSPHRHHPGQGSGHGARRDFQGYFGDGKSDAALGLHRPGRRSMTCGV